MSFLRFKQSIINRLSPQNANKNYLLPNRRFNENSIDPLPAFEFEFRNVVADSAMVFPYDLRPDESWQVSFEVTRIYNQANQPLLVNSALSVTIDNPSSTNHYLRVIMFATGQTFTAKLLNRGAWYTVTLINTPTPAALPTNGALQVLIDGQVMGTINYVQGAYAPSQLIAAGFTATGTIAAFRGTIRNLVIGSSSRDQCWQVDNNDPSLLNTGTNPVGSGSLVRGSNPVTDWLPGSCGVVQFRYSYSAPDVADAIELDLDRMHPGGTLNLVGIVIKWQPSGTILSLASITLKNGSRTVRIALTTPQALAAGEGLLLEYTRVSSQNPTLRTPTIAYNVPRPTFLLDN